MQRLTFNDLVKAWKLSSKVERAQQLIAGALKKASTPAKAASCEVSFLLGLASIVYGVWQIYKPGAFLVAGIIICMIAASLRTET